MDEDDFWALIERSRDEAGGDPDGQAEVLGHLLRGCSDAELLEFARCHDACQLRADRWQLRAAGSVIEGGMGDDSFVYFRDWLISRGREVFEDALRDPDSLADLPDARPGHVTAELVGAAMYSAWRERHDEALPATDQPEIDEPTDEHSPTEDELKALVPRLYARYGQ